jgi:hypothetical protein
MVLEWVCIVMLTAAVVYLSYIVYDLKNKVATLHGKPKARVVKSQQDILKEYLTGEVTNE